ncbi:MAG: FKBP-rapamycin associated protein, partial [Planctomycetaceae bacterium]
MRRQFWLALASAWIGINASGQDDPVTAPAAVSPARADAAALAELFAEQHVVESGPAICQRAVRQSPAARFEALRTWVIPDSAASRFRLTADFVAGGMESPSEGAAGDEPLPPAVRLVSPAYELIRVAGELNELRSLRAFVTACPAGTPAEELDRLALLALIDIHANEQASLEDGLDQWFKRIQPDPTLLRSSIPGLLLLAQATIDRANASPLIREMVRFATYAYRAEYNREAWLRHLVAFSAKLDAMQAAEAADKANSPKAARAQWHLANLERAFEHGNAFPLPLYKLQSGSYRNLSNYGDMLLLFQSPLLGDYSVEATATGFGYREAHIVAGGRWTGPVYNHQQIMIGDPRGELVRQSITPPLGDTSK